MTKDLAEYDYADYYQWEWTGFRDQPETHSARGFWIARPWKHYALTLPAMHVNEVLENEDYLLANRTFTGMINDNYGEPAQKRMKGWVTMEMMMSFAILTSKRMDTKGWQPSQWNRLFHEQGLIELTPTELRDLKQLERDFDKLSRTTVLGGKDVEKS